MTKSNKKPTLEDIAGRNKEDDSYDLMLQDAIYALEQAGLDRRPFMAIIDYDEDTMQQIGGRMSDFNQINMIAGVLENNELYQKVSEQYEILKVLKGLEGK